MSFVLSSVRSAMGRWRNPGLSAVFMAVVLTAMLPVVALMVASAVNQRTQARRMVSGEAARVARLAALREADLIDGGRNVLQAIAGQGAFLDRTGDACSARLAELLPLYPRFANMGVVDRAGELVCSAIKPVEKLNFADRPWFQRAVATQDFAVGDYQRGRITGKPSLVFGVPVVDNGRVVTGVVWAALDLSWLQQFSAQVKLPGKPAVALLDRGGTVLARYPDPDRVGTRVRDIDEVIRRSHLPPREIRGIDGVTRLYASVVLGDPSDPHAIVAVGIPTSVVYRDANRALQRNLVVLAIISGLGIGAARLAANRFILDPSRSLVAVAQRLAGGDLAARVGPPYAAGEIGAAGQAFDAMAVSLESRDQALTRAAEVQRKSEARFRAVLEAAPDAIVGVDRSGTVRLVNRRAEALFRRKREELLGTSVRALCPDAPVEVLVGPTDDTATPRTSASVDVVAVRGDGSTFPAEVTAAALDTEEGPLLSIAVRDVTARKEAEDAVARIADQLQAIIDNAPALISLQDTEGRYILVNRQFEAVRGVDRASATGRTPTELFGPEAGEEIRLWDIEPLVTGEAVEAEEVIFVDGEPHWFLSLRFPLHDATGGMYAVCAILTDVTERIEAESQREALSAQLQQSQRLESLGQLAGGIAHDFNNLLGVILNYADFILDAVESAPGELEPHLAAIQADTLAIFQAAQTAATLTQQLLIFGRRDPVQPRLLDPDDIVRSVEPLLRRTIGEDIKLELSLDAGSVLVRADRGRLEQVLLNVVVNARDAMPSGGRLVIASTVVDIDDAAALEPGPGPGRWFHVAISDTGAGMSSSVAARAFEPFFTTKPKGRGTGLGLATVFGVVRDAGGYVVIDSEPGQGTTVRIYLPAAQGDMSPDDGGSAEEAEEGTGQTILVVEDDDVMREVARRILTRQGYSVITAADATEALRVCEDRTIELDLVLSDVVMPGLSGPDLIVRLHSIRPEIRSIYMSGYPEDLVARRHPGDDVAVIRKPFTPGVLLRQIRKVLETP